MKSILLIDKSPTVIKRIKELSESQDFEFLVAQSKVQTYQRIRNHSLDIKLIFIDVLVEQDYGGFELIEEIKEMAPHIPVVIFTTLNSRTDFIHGIKVGAADYILKPSDDLTLIEKIQKHMRKDTEQHVPYANKSIDFNTYLRTEIKRGIKGDYPVSLGIIGFIKKNSDKSLQPELMKHSPRIYKRLQGIFFETDIFLQFGDDYYLVVLPFCGKENVVLVQEKIISTSHRVIEDFKMVDCSVTSAFVTMPDDSSEHEQLLERLAVLLDREIANHNEEEDHS